MTTVQELAAEVVAREGGYVDDPDDPGGATNFGVTIHTIRRLGLDINGDGQIDKDDVRRITRQQAINLFLRHYFEAPGIGKLPSALHSSVFDMYVNAGSNAVKILQRLLGHMGYDVTVDGVIGQHTAKAAAAAAKAAPNHFVDAYGIARRNYYYTLAEKRPASRKFACAQDGSKGGWIKRAEEFISTRFHLTDQDHRARTVSWA